MAKVRVRKRGKTYSYSFDIQKSPRRMKEKGGFPTKEAAYEAGMTAFVDWRHGNIGITSERVTLNDFFRSWFANVVKKSLRPGTMKTYHQYYKKHIAPHLGAMYLQDIRPRHIDAFYRALAETDLKKIPLPSPLAFSPRSYITPSILLKSFLTTLVAMSNCPRWTPRQR